MAAKGRLSLAMTTTIAKQWQLPSPPRAHSLPSDVPLPVVQILLARGIDTAEKLRYFLDPPQSLPYDPLRLAGMEQALARLYQAVSNKEKVGIFGDFDVDGVTGTAIVAEGLTSLGVQVVPYLPQRMVEGHGLSKAAVENLVQQGVSLIITVDTGVTSIEEVAHARNIGADVIITDHHVPHAEMPDAVAVLNPKLPGGSYPFLDLCGAGLAFKLMQGLYQFYGQPWASGLLELAALGTIADLVPLVDENRYLVQQGLRELANTKRPGLQALYRRAGVETEGLNAETVSFQIAPRLNSAGRLAHAMDSFRLLITESQSEAEGLADKLEDLNRQRRDISEKAFTLALEQVNIRYSGGLPPIVVVQDPRINPGVSGLVAGRLAELLHRPAVVVCGDGDRLVASGRSIPAFNIVEAFEACQSLMVRHGGHAQAAGFTVERDNLPALTENLTAVAEEALAHTDLQPRLAIDAQVRLSELGNGVTDWLSTLEPFGPTNPAPLFLTTGARIQGIRYMGNVGQHLKLRVSDGGSEWNALAFNQGEDASGWISEGDQVDLVYTVISDRFQGPGALALRVVDFHLSGG